MTSTVRWRTDPPSRPVYLEPVGVEALTHPVWRYGVAIPTPSRHRLRTPPRGRGWRQQPNQHSALAVDVNGANVTLTATVHSWAERDLATRSAWGSAGVRHVVDKMSLAY